MGQKIHPYGLRLGIVTDWKSRWYSEKDYAFQANQDHQIRKYLTNELRRGALSRIDIERIGANKVQVDVHTGRPGVVIGRGGSEAERLRSGLEKLTDSIVKFNVIEVQNVELDATLLARSVADQLEGRVSFRRAMKRAVATALKAGAEGIRVQASGRLGGSDMGRREWYLEGRVPLHTLRADIDYGKATARTTVGAIGVQVWVYKGDLLPSAASSREKIAAEARLAAGGPAKRRRSAKSRAEAAAGDSGPRLIEAGGGKRIVEAGGGKRRPGGRRLIEAGGGRRLSKQDAESEFEAARLEAEETLPEGSTPAPRPDAPADAQTVAAAAEPAEPAGVVEDAPAEDVAGTEAAAEPAVEEAVVEEAVVEEAVVEEAAAEVTEVPEAVVEEPAPAAVVEEASAEVTEVPEAVVEEPAPAAVVEETVAEEAPAEEAPGEEAAADVVAAAEAPVEDAPVDEAPVDEAGPVETDASAEAEGADGDESGELT